MIANTVYNIKLTVSVHDCIASRLEAKAAAAEAAAAAGRFFPPVTFVTFVELK